MGRRSSHPCYQWLLDFDHFAENVEVEAVQSLVREFNNTNFRLFSWCLAGKAQKRLGPGCPGSQSGKLKKARALGIRIVSEKELKDMLGVLGVYDEPIKILS